jgi:hypothetical protein
MNEAHTHARKREFNHEAIEWSHGTIGFLHSFMTQPQAIRWRIRMTKGKQYGSDWRHSSLERADFIELTHCTTRRRFVLLNNNAGKLTHGSMPVRFITLSE